MPKGVKVTGKRRLTRKLDDLPKVAQAEIRRAMERHAKALVRMMRRLVPVGDGDLKRSIGWTWDEPPKGSLPLATGSLHGSTITVYAGNDEAFYARFVEFGRENVPAQPFFLYAWRALGKKAKRAIKAAARRAARKVASS